MGEWRYRGKSSFVTLFPIKDDPQGLNEFRPIPLIGCMYKIISNVLANRLTRVLGNIIDERQSTFVGKGGGGGGIMLDNVLVANKMVNDAECRKKPCLVFKVDFEKVYDYTC